jgi:hypothetical protein
MADPEINADNVKRYYRALVSAYKSVSKLAPAPKAAPISQTEAFSNRLTSAGQGRRTILKKLKTRILSLETRLRKAHPDGEAERKRLRRLETKIDIFRARLERLQG